MKKHPSYDGYLFTNDDAIVNWWTLLSLDPRKIWRNKVGDYKPGLYRFGEGLKVRYRIIIL